jgi:hypothetical protein
LTHLKAVSAQGQCGTASDSATSATTEGQNHTITGEIIPKQHQPPVGTDFANGALRMVSKRLIAKRRLGSSGSTYTD